MPTTILHISDTHAGLMAGLIAPGTELEYDNGEKRTHELSSTSAWVWECYQKLIKITAEWAGDDPVVVYHTGDVCHGSRFLEYLYSVWQEHQETIATAALSSLRQIPQLAGFRFCYGSAAHDYGQQSATKNVSANVAAWGYPVACVDHGVEEIDGCMIDWFHRGPKVSATEDRNSTGRRFVIRLCRTFLERGKRAPDVVLCGHVHARITEQVLVGWGKLGHSVMLSVGSPLCGMNEYARNYTMSAPIVEVGGTLIRVSNGRVLEHAVVTWEQEQRQTIDGVIGHKYQGSPRSVNNG